MGGLGSNPWGGQIIGGGGGGGASQLVVSDILYRALRAAGVLRGPGRGPSQTELNDAFNSLNAMVDTWNTERMMIYTITGATYSLTAGKQTYTIGKDPSGATIADFDAPRPQFIQWANILSLNNPAQPLRIPLDLLDDQEWAKIRIQLVPSAIPTKLYNDGSYPLSNLNFWPYPNAPVDFELFTWTALSTFAGTGDTVVLPPGYERAIVYNLALELCALFGTEPRAIVLQNARESKAAIKSLNAPAPTMQCDPAVMTGGRKLFNYLIGE